MKAWSDVSESVIQDLTNILNAKKFNMIEKQYVHKRNPEYVLVSEIEDITERIMEKGVERNDKEKYFYTTAFPKYNCAFCFDHELDHMPFMMTIEVIRQVGVAIGHKFHGFPVTGFLNIMDRMQMQIDKFIELDIPLLVLLRDVVLRNKSSRQERMVYFDLYQNGVLCARIEINAIIMKTEIYSRLRKTNRMELVKNTSLSEKPATNIDMINKLQHS